MTQNERELNKFLVEVFNDILRLEAGSLAEGDNGNLSVSELHVLEAIEICGAESDPSMTDVAQQLCVSAGTLTVAVKTLEQKGYLQRQKSDIDKRRVIIKLLPKSFDPLENHSQFHEKLVNSALSKLSGQELSTLAQALSSLHTFFKSL